MARLRDANVELAREIIDRYPQPKSALIPLLHLAQEQDGWLSEEAMAHIAELVGVSAAEVMGTATFYEMFKLEPVGRYVINVCTNIACQLLGGEELLHHAEQVLGIRAGGTTPDGQFTLEDVECIACCTEAPCAQVNYRYRSRLTLEEFDEMLTALRRGDLSDEIPDHGVLARVRQHIPDDRRAGPAPVTGSEAPPWLARNSEAEEATDG
jgi:NADH-quinone oxidoreductase subunit E